MKITNFMKNAVRLTLVVSLSLIALYLLPDEEALVIVPIAAFWAAYGYYVVQAVIAVALYVLTPKPKSQKATNKVQREGVDNPLERLYGKRRMTMVITNATTSRRVVSPHANPPLIPDPSAYSTLTYFGEKNYAKGDRSVAFYLQGPICVQGRRNGGFLGEGDPAAFEVLVNEQPYNDESLIQRPDHQAGAGTAFVVYLKGETRDGYAEQVSNYGQPSDKWAKCIHASVLAIQNLGGFNKKSLDAVFSGIPKWSFLMQSNNLWDPRYNVEGVINTPASWTGRNSNPALQLLDYLLDGDFGIGVTLDEIDIPSFITMATIADIPIAFRDTSTEIVIYSLPDGATVNFFGQNLSLEAFTGIARLAGWTEQEILSYLDSNIFGYIATTVERQEIRYLMESNITLDTSDPLNENIEQLLAALRGARLWKNPEGKWKVGPAWLVEEDIPQIVPTPVGLTFELRYPVGSGAVTVTVDGVPRAIASQELSNASAALSTTLISYKDAFYDNATNTLTINFSNENTPAAINGNKYILMAGNRAETELRFVAAPGNPVVDEELYTWVVTTFTKEPIKDENYGGNEYTFKTYADVAEISQGITLDGPALTGTEELIINYNSAVVPGIPIAAHIVSDPIDLGLDYDAFFDDGTETFVAGTNLPLLLVTDETASVYSSVSLDDRFNQAIVKYPDEENLYKINEAVWPETGSTTRDEMLAEDNQKPLINSVSINSITNKAIALDFAEFTVRQSRSANSVSYVLGPTALILEPNDLVKVTDPLLNLEDTGPSNRYWRVIEKRVSDDATVAVTLTQYETEDYTYVSQDFVNEKFIARLSPLPSATWDVPPFVKFPTGTEAGAGRLQWIAPSSGTISGYVVKMKQGRIWNSGSVYAAGTKVFYPGDNTSYVALVVTSEEPSASAIDWLPTDDDFTLLGETDATSMVIATLDPNKLYTFSVQVVVPTRGEGPPIYTTVNLAEELAPPLGFTWTSTDTTLTINWKRGLFLRDVPTEGCIKLIEAPQGDGAAYKVYLYDLGHMDKAPRIGTWIDSIIDWSSLLVNYEEAIDPAWEYDPAYTGGDPYDINSYSPLVIPGRYFQHTYTGYADAVEAGYIVPPVKAGKGIIEYATTGANGIMIDNLIKGHGYQVWVREILPYDPTVYSMPGPLDTPRPFWCDTPGATAGEVCLKLGEVTTGLVVQLARDAIIRGTGYYRPTEPSLALKYSKYDVWINTSVWYGQQYQRNETNTDWVAKTNNVFIYWWYAGNDPAAWADGKVHLFWQPEKPRASDILNYPEHNALGYGDQWYDTNDGLRRYYYDGTKWVAANSDSDPGGAGTFGSSAANINFHRSFFADVAPVSGMVLGDLWFETDNDLAQQQYDGTAWGAVTFSTDNTLLSGADNPAVITRGESYTFFSSTKPQYHESYRGGDPSLLASYDFLVVSPGPASFEEAIAFGYITAPIVPVEGEGEGDILVVATEAGNLLYWWNGLAWVEGHYSGAYTSSGDINWSCNLPVAGPGTTTYEGSEFPEDDCELMPDPACAVSSAPGVFVPPSIGHAAIVAEDVYVEDTLVPNINWISSGNIYEMEGPNIIIWPGGLTLKYSIDYGVTWTDHAVYQSINQALPDSPANDSYNKMIPMGFRFYANRWYALLKPSAGTGGTVSNERTYMGYMNGDGTTWTIGPALYNGRYANNSFEITSTGELVLLGRRVTDNMLMVAKYNGTLGSGGAPANSVDIRINDNGSALRKTSDGYYAVSQNEPRRIWVSGGVNSKITHNSDNIAGSSATITGERSYVLHGENLANPTKIYVWTKDAPAGNFPELTAAGGVGTWKGLRLVYSEVDGSWRAFGLGSSGTTLWDAWYGVPDVLDPVAPPTAWVRTGQIQAPFPQSTSGVELPNYYKVFLGEDNWNYAFYFAGAGAGTNQHKMRIVKWQYGAAGVGTVSADSAETTSGDPYFYGLAYGTDFETFKEWKAPTTAGYVNYSLDFTTSPPQYANTGKFTYNDLLLKHVGASQGSSLVTNDSYHGTQCIYKKASDVLYVENLAPLGLPGSGASSTVQMAVKFKTPLAVNDFKIFCGEWNGDYTVIAWGIKRLADTGTYPNIQTNHVIELWWRYESGGESGLATETVTSSTLVDFNVKKWHLYRVAVNFSLDTVSFFIDEELLEALSLGGAGTSADKINLATNLVWIGSAKYSDLNCYIGSGGSVGTVATSFAIDGWFDAIRIYDRVAIIDVKSGCGYLPSPPLSWQPPISSPIRDFLNRDAFVTNKSSYSATDYWMYADGDTGSRAIDEKFGHKFAGIYWLESGGASFSINFTESAGSNSFIVEGSYVDRYGSGDLPKDPQRQGAIFGTPSVGVDPLVVNGTKAVQFTSDANQGYVWGGLVGVGNDYNAVFTFVIKHDGTAKVRTLLFIGDFQLFAIAYQEVKLTIELTALHELRVGIPTASSTWSYFTSTTIVPIDEVVTISLRLLDSWPDTDIQLVVNDLPVESGSVINSWYETGGNTASKATITVGGKLEANNGKLYDYDINTPGGRKSYMTRRNYSDTVTFTESAEGVTFEHVAISDDKISSSEYPVFGDFGAALYAVASENEYTTLKPKDTLLSDIRFQGVFIDDEIAVADITDMIGQYHWKQNDTEYVNTRFMDGNLSSLILNAGVPGVSAGRVECLDTDLLMADLADGPFCFELWQLTREVGISSQFGTTATNAYTTYLRAFFGLIDETLGTNTPYFEVVANGEVFSAAWKSKQPYMRLYDESAILLSAADDPTVAGTPPLAFKMTNDRWEHVAFTREISGADSIYRLFVNGDPIYTYTLVGRIIDYSLLSGVFRYGSPTKRFTSTDNAPWYYFSSARIWSETKYTVKFTPPILDNRLAAYNPACPLLDNHTTPLKVGDTFKDTDTGKTHTWDGTTWVLGDTTPPLTTSATYFSTALASSMALAGSWEKVTNFSPATSIGDPYRWPTGYGGAYPGAIDIEGGEYKISVTGAVSVSADIRLSGDSGLELRLGGPADLPLTASFALPAGMVDYHITLGRGALVAIEINGTGNLTALTWTITKL